MHGSWICMGPVLESDMKIAETTPPLLKVPKFFFVPKDAQ